MLAALGGGCSADVGRFDFPGLGVADKDGSPTTIPRPTVPMRSGGKSLIDNDTATADGGYAPPAPSHGSGVRMAALPAPVTPPQQLQPVAEPRRAPLAQPVADRAPPARGEGHTIEVQTGDTLYGLSKRHKVPVSELMSANGLTGPALKPGQKLVIPAAAAPMRPGIKSRHAAETAATPSVASGSAASRAPSKAANGPAAHAANWDGSYTVKPGDSIYAIAKRHKVSQNELQQINGIADPLKVRPGTTLKVPAEGGTTAAHASEPAPSRPDTAPTRVEPVADAPRVIPSTTQPTIINGGQKIASRGDTATDVTPGEATKSAAAAPSAEPSKGEKSAAAGPAAGSAAGSMGKLRWPVKGKVVTGFGPRPDGTHNDGVNVSVPLGTEVHAAEGGVVAYAGSELKGYGNLILLRHDNGWVTAYAHAEELLVKRGERVKRGQVVAKAGKSGQVDQPQLHFELRQGSKPVDPTPFMEKM